MDRSAMIGDNLRRRFYQHISTAIPPAIRAERNSKTENPLLTRSSVRPNFRLLFLPISSGSRPSQKVSATTVNLSPQI
jgi:hypothetical protein